MDFDAIVVGSGITGGWVAKELCERGVKTLMIERGRHVNHKTDYMDFATPWEMPNRGMVAETEATELEAKPELAFDRDFLRRMLSDGAGAVLIEPAPRAGALNLRIEWIEIFSYAGEMETCMYAGAAKLPDGSIRGWLGAISELDALSAQRVVPGHGPVSEWPAALADERRYLQTLASDVRGLVARDEPISAAGTAAGSERARWELFDDYNTRNATAAFSEIEWE
jgi:glycine/D-amino acid oxidase-like deaminating enzyme